MSLLFMFFFALNFALNPNAIDRFLLNSSAVLSGPHHAERKALFLHMIREELTPMRHTQCQGSTLRASWQEYCYKPRGTVVELRPCPILGSEPSADFYSSHCILSYLFFTVNSWSNDIFSSSDNIGHSLNQLFLKLSREECGHDQSHYCDRMTSICYRGINPSGTCWPAERICTPGSVYYLHCSEIGQVHLLKQALIRRLHDDDKNVAVHTDAVSDNPGGRNNFKDRAPARDNSVSNNNGITFRVQIALVATAIVVAVASILGTVFLYRRCKKRDDEHEDDPSNDALLEDPPSTDKSTDSKPLGHSRSVVSEISMRSDPSTSCSLRADDTSSEEQPHRVHSLTPPQSSATSRLGSSSNVSSIGDISSASHWPDTGRPTTTPFNGNTSLQPSSSGYSSNAVSLNRSEGVQEVHLADARQLANDDSFSLMTFIEVEDATLHGSVHLHPSLSYRDLLDDVSEVTA